MGTDIYTLDKNFTSSNRLFAIILANFIFSIALYCNIYTKLRVNIRKYRRMEIDPLWAYMGVGGGFNPSRRPNVCETENDSILCCNFTTITSEIINFTAFKV